MQQLILIRGLPGSGKSTLAKELATDGLFAAHFEADMFWGPNYEFDVNRLREAHQWCQNSTKEALLNGESVIVSNTFTTIKELKPYFEIAKEFGIVPQVLVCQNNFGNTHNVPEETLAKMKARFAYDVSSLFV